MKTQLVKGFIILSSVILAGIVLFYLSKNPLPRESREQPREKWGQFEKFKSDQEFIDYLSRSESQISTDQTMLKSTGSVSEMSAPGINSAAPAPDRVSQTNVQVIGIDEPDIVKTDGKEIYLSSQARYKIQPVPIIQEKSAIMPPREINAQTLLINVSGLKKDSQIDKSGNLLLFENILMVFENNKISGYDVKNPSSPEKKWQIDLKDNVQIVGTRLYNNKVYFIAKKYLGGTPRCPIEILPNSIRCMDIYHPTIDSQADSAYVAVRFSPQDGNIEKTISFVGSASSTTVYMSKNFLYSTYQYSGDTISFFINFLSENSDLFPVSTLDKIKKLNSYDISQNSKQTELNTILNNYQNFLGDDEKLKFENNLNNKMTAYQKAHIRDLGQTGIVKIDLDSMDIAAHSSVPGNLLNQFSLDEFENNLRVATTVGNNFGFFGSRSESANDVYVLDNNLKIIGSVTDLGLTERIYSARFIMDKGYLVTFRQTDPFYVLDLSNPRSPKMSGELKIPGFSSYLHPISKNIILGVGSENNKVKISLFDVSNSSNPIELDKYNLGDYWTEVSNNHHAFLQDPDHKIFFMPGSKGAYIFSYQNNKLSLVKTLADYQTLRALYINDFLYIITEDLITVLSENTWEKVTSLSLN